MFCNSPPRAMARMENSVRRKNNTLDKNQRAFVHLLDIVTPVGALKTVIYACVKNGPESNTYTKESGVTSCSLVFFLRLYVDLLY
jgi:hypothetical protein